MRGAAAREAPDWWGSEMLRNRRHSHLRELDVLLLPLGALVVMLLLALIGGPHAG